MKEILVPARQQKFSVKNVGLGFISVLKYSTT